VTSLRLPRDELTHASFFSGVGGLDMGLERAGWRTVSLCEVDPFASAVLAQRWPDVPNLGDVTALRPRDLPVAARDALLWSGGFPCQDLSIAGRRRGFGLGHGGAAEEDTRSGLAFAFLDLVAACLPPAVLLENVPGLLSSHGGRDMAALLGALVDLGYGVAWRVLDARHFGVPQRRRRVFILGVSPGGRPGAERAAEVLSVGSRCGGHPPPSERATRGGKGEANGPEPSVSAGDFVGPLDSALGHHGYSNTVQSAAAGHLVVAPPITAAQDRNNYPGDQQYVVEEAGVRRLTPTECERLMGWPDGWTIPDSHRGGDDGPLPYGVDPRRYQCCGNGVVSDVGEWVGRRMAGRYHGLPRARR
jgi:DNA (cytosine-5)-methyltransferase 1